MELEAVLAAGLAAVDTAVERAVGAERARSDIEGAAQQLL